MRGWCSSVGQGGGPGTEPGRPPAQVLLAPAQVLLLLTQQVQATTPPITKPPTHPPSQPRTHPPLYPELAAPGSGVSAEGRWSHSLVAPLMGVIVSTLACPRLDSEGRAEEGREGRAEEGALLLRQLANDSRSCGANKGRGVGQGVVGGGAWVRHRSDGCQKGAWDVHRQGRGGELQAWQVETEDRICCSARCPEAAASASGGEEAVAAVRLGMPAAGSLRLPTQSGLPGAPSAGRNPGGAACRQRALPQQACGTPLGAPTQPKALPEATAAGRQAQGGPGRRAPARPSLGPQVAHLLFVAASCYVLL